MVSDEDTAYSVPMYYTENVKNSWEKIFKDKLNSLEKVAMKQMRFAIKYNTLIFSLKGNHKATKAKLNKWDYIKL